MKCVEYRHLCRWSSQTIQNLVGTFEKNHAQFNEKQKISQKIIFFRFKNSKKPLVLNFEKPS